MIEMVGTSQWILIVLLPAALAAWLMGQAIAATWRPFWQLVIYSLMLGCANRFMIYALFDANLVSGIGYLLDTALLLVVSTAAYRFTLVRKMVTQYPWLYERLGPFAWRDRR